MAGFLQVPLHKVRHQHTDLVSIDTHDESSSVLILP